ncbi:hypothetical protein QNI19_05500 [Cytophagaceae bacterium DM2B3-1]|uniref:Tetratricopeptide repeat protein n=1 Tax=Xanthocytophaga flava TaxID=3048013 RepID=A0AAE3QW72_9BACT|nr:hypothetical protein [Xanthocytophaga flavus]MDJ1472943.1 hypothetical protein [Xanthocytophaga flavus]MDJ1483939.1 hypothetical protein [Xanthocytophaga flavus]MDJ1492378.1 hypothetical protein [Xanthocytophaga flavus]
MVFSPKFWLIVFAVSWLPNWNILSKSGEIREYKYQANLAFQQGNYEEALIFYKHLYEILNVGEEEVLVNLAHCYFIQKKQKQATALYQIASQSPHPAVKSLAWQQLGVLAYNTKRYDWASTCFRNSLKSNPRNEDARYNYELTEKLRRQNKPKTNPQSAPAPKPPDPPKPEWEDNENNAESANNSQVEQDPYAETGMSKEQADILLEAMKDAEKQYIQQQKKQGKKASNNARPDW